jgi:integrase
MDMKFAKTLSIERINKNLQRAGMLFEYAIRHGIYEGVNPGTDLNLPDNKWAADKRAPFTDSELERLFRSNKYIQDSFNKAYRFWIPILGLFHGMRLNEIAGLYLDDVKQSDDGVWYFDLFSRKSNPKAARRVAPLHPFLISELNFLDHVEKMRGQGFDRVFPELSKSRDGYGKNFSRWFNETYKQECGIESKDGRMRDFHSFRTTFVTRLRHYKVHDRMLKSVVGHSTNIDITDRYTDPYPPEQLLKEVIERVDFHRTIDLSHLKNSKWVVKP